MVWHDCKTDPPKKNGSYILIIKTDFGMGWISAFYDAKWNDWVNEYDEPYENPYNPYKWTEVDLSEVE